MTLDPSPVHSRVAVAFDAGALVWAPTWTGLDANYPNLVTSYSIDRGRQYELDRTDVGRATVEIADVDGVLDPTNPSSPYVGKIEPLKQVQINRFNPVDGNWYRRFRGWVEEYDYSFHPSQRVNMLTLTLVDIFEILAAIEMQLTDPPSWGIECDKASAGNICWFDGDQIDTRINQILGQANIPDEFSIVFTGNVHLWGYPTSPGESALTAIQEAADAEFPGVANVYTDRYGRLCAHGRYARFHPAEVAASAGDTAWDWHHWHAGDSAAVAAAPGSTAHLRRFAVNRGLAKVINSAVATPVWVRDGSTAKPPTAAQLTGQLEQDLASQGTYGIRSWSAENLLTMESVDGLSDSLVETKRFAEYYVRNYASPRNRVTDIAFRTMCPGQPGATATWNLLSKVDIADQVDVTLASPGGGGLTGEPYFVEGVHETVQPLNADMDDITVTLDLSPQAYFDEDPWA